MSRSFVHALCCAALALLSACATPGEKRANAALARLCLGAGFQIHERVILPPGLPLYTVESYTAYEPYRIYAPVTRYRFRPVVRSRRILNPHLFAPSAGAAALGPDYQIKEFIEPLALPALNLSEGFEFPDGITFWRVHDQIIRKSDGKPLGEVLYVERRGNSLWAQSLGCGRKAYRCPEGASIEALVARVFAESPDSDMTE